MASANKGCKTQTPAKEVNNMHQKPIHPILNRVLAVNLVLLIIALVVWVIQMGQTPRPVTSIVSNAGRVLVLRFPASSAPWEQFTAKPYFEHDGTISVSRFPVGAISSAPANTIRFAPEEWQPVATLIDEWCKNPPSYEVETDEPFYDIGLPCRGYMRIKIPPDELPSALVYLIETVPSPTCDDPFCGWRE
jgi:hypothetical protein